MIGLALQIRQTLLGIVNIQHFANGSLEDRFFLFFLPGTPKDVLCYIVGLTKISLRSWIIISTIAPIPSIITSTIGGDALGMGNYAFAALVFGITIVISSLGLLAYRAICRARERSET